MIPAVAIVAAAAVVAGALALARGGSSTVERSDDGPLAAESASAESTLRLYAERPATFAGIEVWTDGSLPVVLEGLVPVDPDPGAELIGALAAPSPEGALVVGYTTYPPTVTAAMPGVVLPEFSPLEGYVVEPGAPRTQLHVGVQSTNEAGLVRIPAFAAEYRVGDERYRLMIPAAVAVCTPRTAWDGIACTSARP